MLRIAETKRRARSYLGYNPWTNGMCLKLARTIVGVGARELSASEAWDKSTKRKRTTNYNAVPAGTLYCWKGGSHGYGHIVYVLGGGLCVTNDFAGPGVVSIAKMANITARWGQTPMGYIWQVNGVVFRRDPSRPQKPRLSVAGVQKAMRKDPGSGAAKSHARAVASINLLERRIWHGDVPDRNKRGYMGKFDEKQIKKLQRARGWKPTGVLTTRQIRALNRRKDGSTRWRLIDVPKKRVRSFEKTTTGTARTRARRTNDKEKADG